MQNMEPRFQPTPEFRNYTDYRSSSSTNDIGSPIPEYHQFQSPVPQPFGKTDTMYI
jgi:hypothetical protein